MCINDTLVVGINHRTVTPAENPETSMSVADPKTILLRRWSRTQALESFDNGEYRFAGRVVLPVWVCAPDRALPLAFALTQSVDPQASETAGWRERASLSGDIFAIGRELHLVQDGGFTMLASNRVPKVVEITVSRQPQSARALRVTWTYDNGEITTLPLTAVHASWHAIARDDEARRKAFDFHF